MNAATADRVAGMGGPDAWRFGDIHIRPAQRQVLVAGAPVALGSRAFDLLVLLVEQRDRVVGKDELLARVWPGVVVEENNLSVQIRALRRVLGQDAITNVSGRGYRFTAAAAAPAGSAPSWVPLGNLPARSATLFGRDEALAGVLQACGEAGCVTLCGMAGVGKTALALLAARRLAEARRPAQGAWCVELADVLDPADVARAVCETLGVPREGPQDDLQACVAHLRHGELVLLLDNCEHVVGAVAALVEALLRASPRICLLTTSQEALRVAGERVVRLAPLAVPDASEGGDLLACGAMQLLCARVRGAMGGVFEPSDRDVGDLVEICRQLDGIPLALEFAAARAPVLGLSGVRSRLGDRLRLLASAVRSAPPRHRSLQAALEWSHQLLAPATQRVLHALAVFPSGFSLEGARWFLQAGSDEEVIGHLDVLVERSLVRLQTEPRPRYRLLETTRAFALECLAAAGGGTDWSQRLAETMARVCRAAAQQRDSTWMLQEMGNARTALAWAVEAPGPGATAVTIATYSSVVLGAGGAMREALDLLMRVRRRLDDSCGAPLVARYWHWLGRLGVEGRLPSSVCLDALARADTLFTELGETRHRHGCQRHFAEAEIRIGRLQRAEHHLAQARALEPPGTPPQDRMRRLRVEAMLADAHGRHAESLRHSQAALEIAEDRSVDFYRWLLLADIGWTHLQMGHADAAVDCFEDLLQRLGAGIGQGLARARVQSGLTAALVADGRIDDALLSAGRAVRALQQVNLLRSRCEVFAWVLAEAGQLREAAQLLGAGEAFTRGSETRRDPISDLARRHAEDRIAVAMSADDSAYWQALGADADEDALLRLLERAFAERAPRTELEGPPP